MANQTLLSYRGNNGQHINVAFYPEEVRNAAALLPEMLTHYQNDMLNMWANKNDQGHVYSITPQQVKDIVPEIEYLSEKRIKFIYKHPFRSPNERIYYIEHLPKLELKEVF